MVSTTPSLFAFALKGLVYHTSVLWHISWEALQEEKTGKRLSDSTLCHQGRHSTRSYRRPDTKKILRHHLSTDSSLLTTQTPPYLKSPGTPAWIMSLSSKGAPCACLCFSLVCSYYSSQGIISRLSKITCPVFPQALRGKQKFTPVLWHTRAAPMRVHLHYSVPKHDIHSSCP